MLKKSYALVAAFLALTAIAPHFLQANQDIATFTGQGSRRNTVEVYISSDGKLNPGTDGTNDLGTANERWGDVYGSSVTVDDRLAVSSGAVMNYGRIISTAVAANVTIPVWSSSLVLTSTEGPLNMTATPNISTANARNGDILRVYSTTASITLNDRLSLVNTGLALGAATRVLGKFDSLLFEFDSSTGAWVEKQHTNVQ